MFIFPKRITEIQVKADHDSRIDLVQLLIHTFIYKVALIGNLIFMSDDVKGTFSCGPINMKFAPHEIRSIIILKPTD